MSSEFFRNIYIRENKQRIMCFQKLKALFAEPSKFFKEVSKEKKYWTVLKFFVMIYLAALVIQILASIPVTYGTPIFLYSTLITLFVGIFAAFVSPFVGSTLSHLGIMILGGKKGFFNTFKAVTYGNLIIVGYGILSSLISLILFLLKIEGNPASVILMSLITIAGVVHMLITSSIGVSMYHSISKVRAFFGIVLIPLILIIISVIAFVIISMLIQSSIVPEVI